MSGETILDTDTRRPELHPSCSLGRTRVRVLFVEDGKDCAAAFRRALEKYGIDIMVAGSLADARAFLMDLHKAIDVVLLDLHLPDGRGEDLLPDIEALFPQPGIVILSNFLDEVDPEVTAYRAVLTPKTIAPKRLACILSRAAKGYAKSTLARYAKHFRLSLRETEVLDYVASGASPKGAAVALDCSIQAVYAHLSRIDLKTGCESYQEVVAKLFLFSCHGLGRGAYFEGE